MGISQKNGKPPSSGRGIHAIANAIGVSIATVDRALHDRGRISEETRRRVLETAQKLGYAPNQAARHLRLNRRFRISVNLPQKIESFFDAVEAGVRQGIVDLPSAPDLEMHRIPGPKKIVEAMRAAIHSGSHGVIATVPDRPEIADLIRKAKTLDCPVVCVSTDVPESGRLAAVTAHPFICGAMAAEVLRLRTSRSGQLAFISGPLANQNHARKLEGFQSILTKKASQRFPVVDVKDDSEIAYRKVRELLRNNPKLAGFYVSSANSLPCIEAARAMGRLGNITIVTTDLYPALEPFLRDGTVQATIYQSPEKQGQMAITLLYRYLMSGVVPPTLTEVTPQLVLKSNLDLYTHSALSSPANNIVDHP